MSENIIEKALMFAIIAHSSQVRKANPEEPAIVHPIAVAEILRCYGADKNVISAAYLHDVAEDTKYTLQDIKRKFGEDIEHLVDIASELDKTKTWEERKQNKITKMKEKTLREKLVVIADKIANIEDMERIFKQKGYKDFSAFRRGEKQQEWYYRNMYKSLVENEEKQNPLLIRLKNGIDNVFGIELEK